MKYRIKRFSFVSDSRDAEKLVPGSKELYDKVINKASELGLKVRERYKKSGFEHSSNLRRVVGHLINKKDSSDALKEQYGLTSRVQLLQRAKDKLPEDSLETSRSIPGGRITIHKKSVGAPSIPAHEVGHYLSHLKHPKLNKIRDDLRLSTPTTAVGKVANKVGRYITTVATEADASRKGYKLLKSLGANKDQLKSAGKTMIGGLLGYIKGKGI